MIVLYSFMFIIGFLLAVTPFVIWSWTNFVKSQEIFGILRLKFILSSFVVCYILFIIDICSIAAIVLTIGI